VDTGGKGKAARALREPSVDEAAIELMVALEAELTEQSERLARLEARLDEVERRLSGSATAAPEILPAAQGSSSKHAIPQIGGWPWDEAAEWSYLLRRCEGFCLCDSSGLLGVVESIRFGNDLELPETLVIATGGRGRRRRVELSVSEVAEVDPEQRQVKLAVPARAWLFPGRAHRRLRQWRLPPAAPNP
jgi:hypothetical protein